MPLPSGGRAYKQTKISWSGLNMRQITDSGELSKESNISTSEAPYLTPSQARERYLMKIYNSDKSTEYRKPVGIFGFDSFLLVIYYDKDYYVWVDYIAIDDTGAYQTYTSCLQVPNDDTREADCRAARCVVPFNLYDTPTDPIGGKYVKKLLIFPDKKSMDFEITGGFVIEDMNAAVKEYYNDTAQTDESGAQVYPPGENADRAYYWYNSYNNEIYRYTEYTASDGSSAYGWKISLPPTVPDIDCAAVHLSRVFGVGGGRVYASGFNDYTNWNLDSAGEYNESNSWCSPAQSNTAASGAFTGITVYQNHVVCFKKDFMHEIYGTENPFRLQDIYADGAVNNSTICEVGGRLIFVSDTGVKMYTGSSPRDIGFALGIKRFLEPVAGSDGSFYYLFCYDETHKRRLLVFDTLISEWSEQSIDCDILGFAKNKTGMYMLCEDGIVYKTDTGSYNHSWSFETDLITRQSTTTNAAYSTVNIKHVKKIQMLADIAEGASIKVYFLYDDEEFNESTAHLVYESTGSGKKPIRVKPRKTAHYGIRIHAEGFGYVKLYEMELLFEHGGDLYV